MTPAEIARQMADHAESFQASVEANDIAAAREALIGAAVTLDAMAFSTASTPEDVTAHLVGIVAALRSARFGSADQYLDLAERLAWGALDGMERTTNTNRENYGSQYFAGPEDDPRAVRNLDA